MPKPQWTVLLLGGGSGTGKSVLAGCLSRRFGIPWMHADDIRMALARVVSPADQPLLQFFDDEANWLAHTPAELTNVHEQVGAIACQGLAIVVSHHIAMGEPVILEGDDLLPKFVSAMQREHGAHVRSLFLYEDDLGRLRNNMTRRDRGIMRRPEAVRERMIALAYADGKRLHKGATQSGLAILPSAPFRTSTSRALALIT